MCVCVCIYIYTKIFKHSVTHRRCAIESLAIGVENEELLRPVFHILQGNGHPFQLVTWKITGILDNFLVPLEPFFIM